MEIEGSKTDQIFQQYIFIYFKNSGERLDCDIIEE